ncbi:MAG: signal peptidase I [Clostridiales bacterium]|nr:signal peptidase I [Candidatus Scatonaster coprocaballi]
MEEEQVTTFPTEDIKRVKAGKDKSKGTIVGLLQVIGILSAVAAIVVIISMVFCPVVTITGDSAAPRFESGDIVLLVKNFHAKRGQLCCVKWQNKILLKRIIAVGGDSVNIDGNGNIFVNGVLLEEDYVTNKQFGQCEITLPYQVPEGQLFILSDNRADCSDSRIEEVGCIEEDQILGKVVGKIWPW